ncbi:hypothetical protein F4777DRAFT_314832 [Nemania sp. FL0916]|nr:hypothetical protein F4777DRAFT_314832 [Nemania sp. FL0916]
MQSSHENSRKLAEQAERSFSAREAQGSGSGSGSSSRAAADPSTSTTKRHASNSKPAAGDMYGTEMMAEGRKASQSNIEGNSSVAHKGQYPGAEYYPAEEVAGEMSAEGYEAPESVTEASRESERYNR